MHIWTPTESKGVRTPQDRHHCISLLANCHVLCNILAS